MDGYKEQGQQNQAGNPGELAQAGGIPETHDSNIACEISSVGSGESQRQILSQKSAVTPELLDSFTNADTMEQMLHFYKQQLEDGELIEVQRASPDRGPLKHAFINKQQSVSELVGTLTDYTSRNNGNGNIMSNLRVCPNPVPAANVQCLNEFVDVEKGACTSKKDVGRILWALVDLDFEDKRSLTQDDLQEADERAKRIQEYLQQNEIYSLRMNSGNGVHLILALNALDPADEKLVKALLEHLSDHYSGPVSSGKELNIDKQCSDPGRKVRLHGSPNVRPIGNDGEYSITPTEVVDITGGMERADRDKLVALVGEPAGNKKKKLGSTAASNGSADLPQEVEASLITDALGYIDPEDYETWFRMGCALKDWQEDLGYDADDQDGPGYDIWLAWSAGEYTGEEPENFDEDACQMKWDYLANEDKDDDERIKLGTLYYEAEQNGWPKSRRFQEQRLQHETRPKVDISPSREKRLKAMDIGQAAALSGNVFMRGGAPVVLRTENGQEKFKELGDKMAVTEFERYCRFIKWQWSQDNHQWEEVPAVLGNTEAGNIVNSYDFQTQLPEVTGIANYRLPVWGENGTVRPTMPGYDPETGIYTSPDAPAPQGMSIGEGLHAVENLLSEFCFKNAGDDGYLDGHNIYKLNAIAYLLTCHVRYLYQPTPDPLFDFEANIPGAGKDTVGKLGLYLTIGHEDSRFPTDNTEMRKQIGTAFREGRQFYYIENKKGHLNSGALEGALTLRELSDRILGESRGESYRNYIIFCMSVNNLTNSPDMPRRMIRIKLQYFGEDVNERAFSVPDLHQHVLDNREYYLGALQAMVDEWVRQGCPQGNNIKNSFNKWSRIVGGIMEACGLPNPINRDPEQRDSDEETEEFRVLLDKLDVLPEDTQKVGGGNIGGWSNPAGNRNLTPSDELPNGCSIERNRNDCLSIAWQNGLFEYFGRYFSDAGTLGDKADPRARQKVGTLISNKSDIWYSTYTEAGQVLYRRLRKVGQSRQWRKYYVERQWPAA